METPATEVPRGFIFEGSLHPSEEWKHPIFHDHFVIGDSADPFL